MTYIAITRGRLQTIIGNNLQLVDVYTNLLIFADDVIALYVYIYIYIHTYIVTASIIKIKKNSKKRHCQNPTWKHAQHDVSSSREAINVAPYDVSAPNWHVLSSYGAKPLIGIPSMQAAHFSSPPFSCSFLVLTLKCVNIALLSLLLPLSLFMGSLSLFLVFFNLYMVKSWRLCWCSGSLIT